MTQPTEVKEPLEIIVRGRDETLGYACPVCGTLEMSYEGCDLETVKKAAAEHCNRVCEDCREPISPKFSTVCTECRTKRAAKRDREIFEKAVKITYEQYEDTVLYWPDHSGNMGDGYFSDLDSLVDHCEQNELEMPEYVFACTVEVFHIDAVSLIEQELDSQEFFEGAFDHVSKENLTDLQAFLDGWSKKVDLKCWKDDGRVILLKPEGA